VQDTRLLLGQVSNEIGFAVYGNMNVVGGRILAKVSPELYVGVFAKNRFENERIFSVARFRESETDIDAENLHVFPPFEVLR